jgi:hypothetical protein
VQILALESLPPAMIFWILLIVFRIASQYVWGIIIIGMWPYGRTLVNGALPLACVTIMPHPVSQSVKSCRQVSRSVRQYYKQICARSPVPSEAAAEEALCRLRGVRYGVSRLHRTVG